MTDFMDLGEVKIGTTTLAEKTELKQLGEILNQLASLADLTIIA